MRQIVLDTETTGLEVERGHRIIEIGCVEVIDRRLCDNNFHQYLQPDRMIDVDAEAVHGISNEFLADKPRFTDIAETLIEYLRGAELLIHNAPFDIGFIDAELQRMGAKISSIKSICTIVDTLTIARQKHPGQRNTLDALCKRYEIDNSKRDLHGALLDAKILADVYLVMTSRQISLPFDDLDQTNTQNVTEVRRPVATNRAQARVIHATEEELSMHMQRLQAIDKASDGNCAWLLH